MTSQGGRGEGQNTLGGVAGGAGVCRLGQSQGICGEFGAEEQQLWLIRGVFLTYSALGGKKEPPQSVWNNWANSGSVVSAVIRGLIHD